MVLLATLALWAGSDSLVFGAKNLATLIGVPEELIGFHPCCNWNQFT